MNETIPLIARDLCEQVDWGRPELAATPFAAAYRNGDFLAAALGLIGHLRRRRKPFIGYSAGYVRQLRRHATPAYRKKARKIVRDLLQVPFLGGDWPDGRGTLLTARPEELQVGATPADFDRSAERVAAARGQWQKGAIHTIMGVTRYLQSTFPLAECSDEALLPILGFLVAIFPKEWSWARTWSEAMLGTTGHNWWIAQFGATWKVAFLFPEFKGLARFQSFCPAYVERELRILTYPDGFTHECSVAYHIGTTDLFLDVARLAEANGLRFSRAFRDRLQRMAAVEWKLLQPDGNYPAFNDCHNLGPHLFSRMRSLAALEGIPEMKYLAESLIPKEPPPFGKMLVETLNYPSVGEDLSARYRKLKARKPASTDTALPEAGLYVMRQDWGRRADYAAIDATTKGNLITSHGHGAMFDLMLASRGRAITVGNGKGPDVGMDEPRRVWRVKSESHTVATVDGEDHLPLRSIYRFANHVIPTIDDWITEERFAYFSGVHEAYERLEKKVTGSRRKLFYLRGGYWILIDRFTVVDQKDTHTYRQHFQMGVPGRLLDNGRVVTTGKGGNLLFVPVEGARGVPSIRPNPWPLDGYFNPDQLVFTRRNVKGHMLFVTVLVPFLGRAIPKVEARLLDVEADERVLSPWEATGLETTIEGRRDIYVDLHMHWNLPWQCGGCRGDGRLFHSAV